MADVTKLNTGKRKVKAIKMRLDGMGTNGYYLAIKLYTQDLTKLIDITFNEAEIRKLREWLEKAEECKEHNRSQDHSIERKQLALFDDQNGKTV